MGFRPPDGAGFPELGIAMVGANVLAGTGDREPPAKQRKRTKVLVTNADHILIVQS